MSVGISNFIGCNNQAGCLLTTQSGSAGKAAGMVNVVIWQPQFEYLFRLAV